MSEQDGQPTFAGLIAAMQQMANAWGEHCKRLSEHFQEAGRRWPAERIIAEAIAEHNRRMDEINHRTHVNDNGKAHG